MKLPTVMCLERIEATLARNELAMKELLKLAKADAEERKIYMAWMEELLAAVQEQTSVVAGAKTAFDTLSARLEEELAKPDDEVDLEKVREIKDQIKANTETMAEAIKQGVDEPQPEQPVEDQKQPE